MMGLIFSFSLQYYDSFAEYSIKFDSDDKNVEISKKFVPASLTNCHSFEK